MLNAIMQTLADEHRRQLLVALVEHNPQTAVQIPEGVQGDDAQAGQIQIEMYHTHLPRLEESGFVRWDKEQNAVVKGPAFEQIEPILILFEENADEIPVEWP